MAATSRNGQTPRIWIFQFQLSGTIFGLKVSDTREVVHMAELVKPPGLPSFLIGFVNVEGLAVPVVSLSNLFGLVDDRIYLYTPLVIVRNKQKPMAFIVEKALRVVSMEESRLYPVDDELIFSQCVSRYGEDKDGQKFYLLSPERVLLAQEQQKMSEFQGVAQKRLDALDMETVVRDE